MLRSLLLVVLVAISIRFLFRPQGLEPEDEHGRIILSRELLENPRYPLVIELASKALETVAQSWLLPLDKHALMESAQWRTGLKEFWDGNGNAEFVALSDQGLDAVLKSLNQDARGVLSGLGWIMTRENLINALSVQLRVMDFLQRHPEVRNVELPKVITLAGLPRTGSTAIQSLLCLHPDVECLEFHEALSPIAKCASENMGTWKDLRIWEATGAVAFIHFLRPYFGSMHRLGPHLPFEEILLGTYCFGSSMFDATIANLTSYVDWYISTDQTFSYSFIKLVFQIMHFQKYGQNPAARGIPKYRLIKSPQHTEEIVPILNVFPDARFIVTHRPPEEIMESLLTLLFYSAGTNCDKLNAVTFGKNGQYRLKRLLSRFQEQIGSVDKSRVFHVQFRDFVANNTAVIVNILQRFELDVTPEILDRMTQHAEENPRNAAVSFKYDLGMFGISKEQIAKTFQFYDPEQFFRL